LRGGEKRVVCDALQELKFALPDELRRASEEAHEDISVLCVQLSDQKLPRGDISPACLPVEPTRPADQLIITIQEEKRMP